MIIKCESVKTHYYYTTTEIASTDKNNISGQNFVFRQCMFDQYMFCSYMCSHQNKRTKTNQSSLNLYVFFFVSAWSKKIKRWWSKKTNQGQTKRSPDCFTSIHWHQIVSTTASHQSLLAQNLSALGKFCCRSFQYWYSCRHGMPGRHGMLAGRETSANKHACWLQMILSKFFQYALWQVLAANFLHTWKICPRLEERRDLEWAPHFSVSKAYVCLSHPEA